TEAGSEIGATALALAAASTGVGLPVVVGMAALGGAGGVGLKRAGQAAADVPIVEQDLWERALFPQGVPASLKEDIAELVGQAGWQAVFELFAGKVSKLIRGGAKPKGILKLAEDLKLPTKPETFVQGVARKTITGEQVTRRTFQKGQRKATVRATKEAATLSQPPPLPEETALAYIDKTRKEFKAGLEKAGKDAVESGMSKAEGEVQHLLRDVAPEVDAWPSITGRRAQRAAVRGTTGRGRARGIAGREADRLYAEADELNKDVMVDITDHVQSLRELAEEAMLSPTADPTALVLYTRKLSDSVPSLAQGQGVSGEVERLLSTVSASNREGLEKAISEVLGGSDGALVIPYKEARELQKWLGQRLDKKTFGDIGQGRLKLTWGSLKDSIEESVKGTEGGAALAEANAFYAEFADVAKEGAVPILIERFKSTPSDIINLMARGG
ncbi:hypothetical protein LCGC14_2673500, partial [marine sediment metagenome]